MFAMTCLTAADLLHNLHLQRQGHAARAPLQHQPLLQQQRLGRRLRPITPPRLYRYRFLWKTMHD